MSEYQYYEFQTVDRPLTPEEMAWLRKRSTRATITPTRFQNVYNWSDLNGDPRDWVERYFDAFVYVANWGANWFMVRLPPSLFDPATVRPYAVEDALSVETRGDVVLLDFRSDTEEGMLWIMDEEAQGWMPALLPVREELANGDLRPLYLGWLSAAAGGLLEDDEREPPVPPGLGHLPASLAALAEFLRISEDLLAVAAAASPEPAPAPPVETLASWITALPLAEKDDLLLRLADNPTLARAELLRRHRQEMAPPAASADSKRTVGALLSAAESHAVARERQEAARQAEERARDLDGLAGREDALWQEVDALIECKRAKEYDQAVAILTDLRDLSAHLGRPADFAARFRPLRERNAKRTALLQRFKTAGL